MFAWDMIFCENRGLGFREIVSRESCRYHIDSSGIRYFYETNRYLKRVLCYSPHLMSEILLLNKVNIYFNW